MNQQSIQKRKRSDSASAQPQKRARGRPCNIAETPVRKLSPAELEEIMSPLYDTFEEIGRCNLEVAAVFTLLKGAPRFICGCCGDTDHAGTTRQLYNYETTYNVCNACGLRFKAFVERLHNGGDGRPIRPQSQRTSHIRKTYPDYVYHKMIATPVPSVLTSREHTQKQIDDHTTAPIGTPELTTGPRGNPTELPRINKPVVKPLSPLPTSLSGMITKREVTKTAIIDLTKDRPNPHYNYSRSGYRS